MSLFACVVPSVWMLPEVILCLGAVVLLLVDHSSIPSQRIASFGMGLLGLAALVTGLIGDSVPALLWSGSYAWDPLSRFYKIFFLCVTAFILWLSLESEDPDRKTRAEYYILPLFTAAGLCLLSSARDLMTFFVSLELVTISFYLLVSFQREHLPSLEAAIKYLIFGALASSFLVMGIAYVFGFAHSTSFNAIASEISNGSVPTGLTFGVMLILIGLAFKIGAVPFHSWAPDVYEGSPTPITAYLAIGSKSAGFVLLATLLSGPFSHSALISIVLPFLSVLAGASLLLGNFAAIPQRSFKRLMAYSGIGHAGYLLISLISNSSLGRSSLIYYLVSYFLGAGLSFLSFTLARRKISNDMLYSFAGLSQRAPLLAFSLTVGLVSMAGIPPLAGFFGKFLVFTAAWESHSYWLVVLGVICAIAGLYYYLGLVRYMYWSEPVDTDSISVSPTSSSVVVALSILTIGLGLWPQPVLAIIQGVVR